MHSGYRQAGRPCTQAIAHRQAGTHQEHKGQPRRQQDVVQPLQLPLNIRAVRVKAPAMARHCPLGLTLPGRHHRPRRPQCMLQPAPHRRWGGAGGCGGRGRRRGHSNPEGGGGDGGCWRGHDEAGWRRQEDHAAGRWRGRGSAGGVRGRGRLDGAVVAVVIVHPKEDGKKGDQCKV